VQLYVYNRTAKTLDAIEDDGVGESISLSSPPGGTRAVRWPVSITGLCS
jgi:hypothetical protein